jgi:hypothetical protein
VPGLAEVLGRLCADSQLRQKLGECGRSRCRTEFRWEDKLALVERTYVESLAAAR